MSVERRKEAERYEKVFALVEEIEQKCGQSLSVHTKAELTELSIPTLRKVIKFYDNRNARLEKEAGAKA